MCNGPAKALQVDRKMQESGKIFSAGKIFLAKIKKN
jgi:hypothetical protein